MELCRSSRAPRSNPKLDSSILVALDRLPVLRHGGAIGFLLKAHGPYRCLRDGYRIFDLPAALVLFVVSYFFERPLLPPLPPVNQFLRAATGMVRKGHRGWAECTRQSKWLPKGCTSARRQSSILQYMDKVKKDQDAALDRYIL